MIFLVSPEYGPENYENVWRGLIWYLQEQELIAMRVNCLFFHLVTSNNIIVLVLFQDG